MSADATLMPESERLNILLISAFFPFPLVNGAAVRTYNLARELACRHDVTLLSYVTPSTESGVAVLEREFRVEAVGHRHKAGLRRRLSQLRALLSSRPFAAHMARSDEMQSAIDRICSVRKFDLIQVESCSMAQFRFPDGVPVVIDEHNIEYELCRRLAQAERSRLRRVYNRLEYLRFRGFEQRAWTRSAGCVLTSEREIPQVQRAAPRTPTAVVRNGVDLERFTPSEGSVEPDTVVFNATFDYRPNADAVEYLVSEIWPLVLRRRPRARLLLIGYMPAELEPRIKGPQVEVVGRVEDLQPWLANAAVVVVPLRIGAGTRLKVVEGLAMGKSMVSTTLGAEGVPVIDGEHLLIADTAEAFADRVADLLSDPGLGAQMGAAGRRLMEREYSWKRSVGHLESFYRVVLSR